MIGKRLKELREAKKMSLSELAEKSGVQIATLSRIEHGKMSGTVESHLKIAETLEIDITALYSDVVASESTIPLIETSTFANNDKSIREILITNAAAKKMLPAVIRIERCGSTNKEKSKKGTEKFAFILEGKVEVHIADEVHTLTHSSSIYFDGSKEHYFVNLSPIPAKLICISTPVQI
ncbi:MAG: XRE family transcriptional regulator [Candidatus Zapsychrus exili]|nr:XRE family transcriptional regulator [Candidatus Zapsychrus exili]